MVSMNELPRAYRDYLAATTPTNVDTVEPVLKQSVADGKHGVLVRFLSSEVQAMTSEDVPFGEVREEHLE
jgi:hypothetical protein